VTESQIEVPEPSHVEDPTDSAALTSMAEEAAPDGWVPTGDPRVDDAVERLNDLSGLPVNEHVAVFDEVQRRLHDALAGLVPDV
jgi:hypothetical protein